MHLNGSIGSQPVHIDELIKAMRKEMAKEWREGNTLRALARKMGVSAGHLSRVLRGETKPGPKILDYLGFEEVPFFQRRKQSRWVKTNEGDPLNKCL